MFDLRKSLPMMIIIIVGIGIQMLFFAWVYTRANIDYQFEILALRNDITMLKTQLKKNKITNLEAHIEDLKRQILQEHKKGN